MTLNKMDFDPPERWPIDEPWPLSPGEHYDEMPGGFLIWMPGEKRFVKFRQRGKQTWQTQLINLMQMQSENDHKWKQIVSAAPLQKLFSVYENIKIKPYLLDISKLLLVRIIREQNQQAFIRFRDIMNELDPIWFRTEISRLLFDYVSRKNINDVKFLVQNGVPLNVRDRNNKTPLYYAFSRRGDRDMIRLLLDYGAFPTDETQISKIKEIARKRNLAWLLDEYRIKELLLGKTTTDKARTKIQQEWRKMGYDMLYLFMEFQGLSKESINHIFEQRRIHETTKFQDCLVLVFGQSRIDRWLSTKEFDLFDLLVEKGYFNNEETSKNVIFDIVRDIQRNG